MCSRCLNFRLMDLLKLSLFYRETILVYSYFDHIEFALSNAVKGCDRIVTFTRNLVIPKLVNSRKILITE
jgi:hypothetical protein